MKLYYDIAGRKFRQSLTDDRDATHFFAKRGDADTIAILPILNGNIYRYTALVDMVFAVKPAPSEDDPLLLANAFVLNGATGFYESPLTQDGAALEILLAAASTDFVDLKCELWTDSELGEVTSRTADMRVYDDVWKGTEGTPLSLETPDEWLSERAVRYDEAQTLDAGEKTQARSNLGLGTAATVNTGTTNGTIPVIGAGDKLSASILPSIAITESLLVADSVARLALTTAQAAGKAVVEADTGKSYMLVTGGNPATAGDWLQLGDRDIVSADITDATADGNANTGKVLKTGASGQLTVRNLYVGAAGSELGSIRIFDGVSEYEAAITAENTLTGNRVINVPDSSGTMALTSDLSGLVPYTGASGAVDLGANNLTVDTDTLFVDATNNRVGIGTASPATALDVVGQGRFQSYNNEDDIRIMRLSDIASGPSTYRGQILTGAGTFGTDFVAYRNNASSVEVFRWHTNLADQIASLKADGTFTTTNLTASSTLTVGGTNTWNGSTISGAQAFSSTTRPTSSGTGTPAATSLITRNDGDARYGYSSTTVTSADATRANNNSTQYLLSGVASYSVDANSKYRIEWAHSLTKDATNTTVTWTMAMPSGAVFSGTMGLIQSSNTSPGTYRAAAVMGTEIATGVLSSSSAVTRFFTLMDGVLITTNSGTINPTFACGAACNPVEKAGSYIRITKIA